MLLQNKVSENQYSRMVEIFSCAILRLLLREIEEAETQSKNLSTQVSSALNQNGIQESY